MRDDEKPRRSRAEELAELTGVEARKQTDADARLASSPQSPPLSMIVAQMQAEEEAAYCARERSETSEEVEESARIRMTEVEIEIETPFLRERELRRTFSRISRAQAAAALAD